MSQADSTRGRPNGPPAVSYLYRRGTPGECSRDSDRLVGAGSCGWDGKGVDITPVMALALADIEASKMPLPTELRTEITERRTRTQAWIRSHEPLRPEKTEILAAWIAYEYQRGEPGRAKHLFDELLSRRDDDGGWGIKRGDPSHTLATAVVLFALETGGLTNEDPVVASTQRHLLDRQKEDGRWREMGRHFHPEEYHVTDDA